MKKITPKKVPFETYKKFVHDFHGKVKGGGEPWLIEYRWGWGLSRDSAARFKKLKEDPDPIILEITDIPNNEAYEPYAFVSDYAKYAITVAHQHVKDFVKKIWPDIDLDVPEYKRPKPWPLKKEEGSN